MNQNTIIPKRFHVLSNSALKVIAVVTMVIDHIGVVFLSKTNIALLSTAGYTLTLYELSRDIGRLSFPLFAFLLAEGFMRTRDRKKYGWRLFAFALISEIPWNLEHRGTIFFPESQNVFFTLLLGYLAMCAIYQAEQEQGKKRIMYLLAPFALLTLSFFSCADYGFYGVGFILMLWLLRKHPVCRAVVGVCMLPSRWIGGLAFIPMGMYNGKRGFIKGRVLQFAFYAFYPAHMLLFYLIKRATVGF